MESNASIEIFNKTLNKIEFEKAIGTFNNNEIILKNEQNIFKINIESNIIFQRQTKEYKLKYKFSEGIYTNGEFSLLDFNYQLNIEIYTKKIIKNNNTIIIDYDKYIEDTKEECEIKIKYEEVI